MPKSTKTIDADVILNQAKPLVYQTASEIQPYGHIVKLPIALSAAACKEAVENLNQLLADTMTLRDLYKKHHWQVAGATFAELHFLFDKHYKEQEGARGRDRGADSDPWWCQRGHGARRR